MLIFKTGFRTSHRNLVTISTEGQFTRSAINIKLSSIISDRNTRANLTMSLRRVIIATKKAPDAIGPYNQAVQVNKHQIAEIR